MNHTPGPWTSRESDDLPGFFYVSAAAGDIVYLSGGLQPHDCAANARLIAAAPELREMLDRMVDTYEHEARAENPTLLAAKALLERIA